MKQLTSHELARILLEQPDMPVRIGHDNDEWPESSNAISLVLQEDGAIVVTADQLRVFDKQLWPAPKGADR